MDDGHDGYGHKDAAAVIMDEHAAQQRRRAGRTEAAHQHTYNQPYKPSSKHDGRTMAKMTQCRRTSPSINIAARPGTQYK